MKKKRMRFFQTKETRDTHIIRSKSFSSCCYCCHLDLCLFYTRVMKRRSVQCSWTSIIIYSCCCCFLGVVLVPGSMLVSSFVHRTVVGSSRGCRRTSGSLARSFQTTSTSSSRSNFRSVRVVAAAASLLTMASSSSSSSNRLYHHSPSSLTTACAGMEDSSTETSTTDSMLPESWLTTDHYSGITVHLPLEDDSTTDLLEPSFATRLENSLNEWKQQGIKGVWLHIPHHHADKIATAVQAGFEFHSVQETITQLQQEPNSSNTVSNNNNMSTSILILKRWLPETIPNRLPHGPTHQIGVGCVVFHPHDPTLLLCVQEQTGPAAAYGLWKMPTGLADPHEDVHVAALRELREETGLHRGVTFRGLLQARQAHPNAVLVPPLSSSSSSNNSNEPTNSGAANKTQQHQQLRRSVSDLFFVCWLQLPETFSPEDILQCPDEIAAIQWMSVQDYCEQERWQDAPVYQELNRVIWKLSQQQQQQMGKHGEDDDKKDTIGLLQAYTLPLGFGRGMNTLYHAAGTSTSAPVATSKNASPPAPKSQL